MGLKKARNSPPAPKITSTSCNTACERGQGWALGPHGTEPTGLGSYGCRYILQSTGRGGGNARGNIGSGDRSGILAIADAEELVVGPRVLMRVCGESGRMEVGGRQCRREGQDQDQGQGHGRFLSPGEEGERVVSNEKEEPEIAAPVHGHRRLAFFASFILEQRGGAVGGPVSGPGSVSVRVRVRVRVRVNIYTLISISPDLAPGTWDT